ncbi:MAG: DUF4838 domain-containing protein [Christensenellales bacterium]
MKTKSNKSGSSDWQKRLCVLAAVVVVALCLCLALAGCNKKDTTVMSSETLNITAHLGEYDENVQREQFASEKEICLAKDGVSSYKILIGQYSLSDTVELAETLSNYLNDIVGGSENFEVADDSEAIPEKYIALGDSVATTTLSKEGIADDGYRITSQNGNIFILALDETALSNGVYGFLEDYLGCMFVRSDYDYVPDFPTIYLDDMDEISNPDFAWRKVFQYEAAQNGWYQKLKNNGVVADEIEEHEDWGTWCHTAFTFVSPDEYLDSHPEFFVIRNGEPKQLCLSADGIYPIIEKKMGELIAANPDKKYWDFSIMDNYDYCTCSKCLAVKMETGSMMGTMLPIINKLAQKFPDKIISTLAYFYNETPPSGMTCEENVNIVIAPIQCGQMYSYLYGATTQSAKAKELIEGWGEIAHNILVWDYVVDFSHLLLPFPNYDVQKDNHTLYLDNNVTAIFHQGSRESGDEMAHLRSYILSKLMWDNNVDVSKTLAKYLQVTYGKGAEFVAKYLDTCNAQLKAKANNLDIFDASNYHTLDYLSPSNTDQYLSWLNQAIEQEKNNPAIVSRIEEIKVNLLYAIMEESIPDYNRKQAAFDEFSVLVTQLGIEQPYEAHTPTMQEYLQQYPSRIVGDKIAIAAIVVSPFVLVAIIIAIVAIIRKKKRKKA